MATPLDREEQEQLDALKHFWSRWGNLITWVLIALLGAWAAWSGWQYWERRQGALAAVLYDEVSRAAEAGDTARVERAFGDMKDKYGSTAHAARAGLLAAKVLYGKGKPAEARDALAWVGEKASDDGLRAVARLRLVSVLVDQKAYDEALKALDGRLPPQFTALVADRRGDVLMLQGKRQQAAAEYGRAYQGLRGQGDEYRQLVAVKLNALGIDPEAGDGKGATS
jgi:predicted negative regulator of RcsB-dependent stress response